MVSENEEIEYINTFYKHLAVYIIMQMHTSISKAVITSSAKGHFEIYFWRRKEFMFVCVCIESIWLKRISNTYL